VLLPQVAIQSTQGLAGSLLTVAETCAEVLTGSLAGGSCINATEMSGVCDGGVCGRLVEQPATPKKAARAKANEAKA